MSGTVLHQIDDSSILAALHETGEGSITLRQIDEAIEAWGGIDSALEHADALLLDATRAETPTIASHAARRRPGLPILLVNGNGTQDGPGAAPTPLPNANTFQIGDASPEEVVAQIREKIRRFRRHGEVNRTLQRELQGLKAREIPSSPRKRVVDQLLHAAPVGILLLDDRDDVSFANAYAAAIIGISRDALGDMNIRDLFPHDSPFIREKGLEIGATPDEAALNVAFIQPGGTKRFLSVHVVSLEEYGDGINRMVILEDNTELIVTRKEAEQATLSKSRFLASMSHELRTPINAILGFSDIMRSEMFGDLRGKYLEYSNDIFLSASHLLELVNDALDLSKVEAGAMEVRFGTVRLSESLRSAARLLEPQARAKGIELSTEVADEGLVLETDDRYLRQILFNLVGNAVKFTPRGGTVTLSIQPVEAGRVSIVVRDTGVGISEEDLPRVMEPFSQVRTDPDIAQEGTGLGLPLSKQLTELLGGQFFIASALGEGTSVRIELPA